MEKSKRQLLTEVARAYYIENRTQSEIADSVGISRSQVSRYLSEAREAGIVQIRIVSSDESGTSLGETLLERYPHLRKVIAAPIFDTSPDVVRRTIGRYAANYMEDMIRSDQRLTLGCGRTLREMVKAMPVKEMPGLEVVQAMGNIGHEAHEIDYNEITREAADKMGGRAYYVSAPAILGRGSEPANSLLDTNPMLKQALEMARSARIFVVGLGSLESDLVYSRAGLIGEDELSDLSGEAVGDICGRFFDINGNEKPSAFYDRIVGIELKDIQKGDLSIGVAGGADKAAPILGAIRGKLINVLITDEQTLHSILTLDDAYRG
ncbi:MAG: sugar-binding transcriptional regulator [Anaerolineales bacterium]|nr:sugar-binding transcriptional regulator [Anaerolineales bacterium]